MAQVSEDVAVTVVRISATSNRVRVVGEERHDVSVEGRSRVTSEGIVTTIDSVRSPLVVRVPLHTDLVVGATSAGVAIEGQVGQVAVVTESGRVSIASAASVDVRTTSARVAVGHVAEGCRIRTTSGRVEVGGCGAADVSTRSGRIDLKGVRGPVRAHCVSGRIEVGLESAQDVEAETVSGRVTVSLPPGVRAHRPTGPSDAAAPPDCDCTIRARSVSGRVVVSSG